jgi:hypothetical protein
MSQITKSAQAKPVASDETYGRAITATLALAAALIAVAFLLARSPASVPAGTVGADRLTDGFLPGAMAANAAEQIRNAQALDDGWEAGIVGPVHAAQQSVRDGWEGGLVPPAASRNEIRDGWESSLFR